MSMLRVTATEFQKSPGTYSDTALHEPVAITKRDRDHLVLISAREYARLKRRDREAGATEDLPEEALAQLLAAKIPAEFADD
jgi:PHD/YefM family antitoxin component YafN of YafNO toxin-antitoxin module